MELIDKAALYNKIAELEELARNRVVDTPTSSPAYQRYSTQLTERTALKHLIADTAAVDAGCGTNQITLAKKLCVDCEYSPEAIGCAILEFCGYTIKKYLKGDISVKDSNGELLYFSDLPDYEM